MRKNLKNDEGYRKKISSLDEKLFAYFRSIMKIDNNLSRQLVSFQANKKLSTAKETAVSKWGLTVEKY